MNNLRSFKRFIVVEKNSGRPMAFSEDQFCYCTTSYWEDWHFPVKTYSYKHAMKLIEKSKAYRKRMKFDSHLPTDYLLVPFSKR